MNRYFALAVLALACGSPDQQSAKNMAAADSLWSARVRSGTCRRPTYATSNWPEFLTAKGSATIRIPPFLRQDRFQAAAESAKANGQIKVPRYATGWNNFDSGDALAQFAIGVKDSVRLAYQGAPEPEETICLETIDGAQATVLGSNRGATKTGGAAAGSRATAARDTAAPLGPYFVNATMRFPDGLGLLIYGTASTEDQQKQMLAAIRTVRRVSSRR